MKFSWKLVFVGFAVLSTASVPAESQTGEWDAEISTDPATPVDLNLLLARKAGIEGDFVVVLRTERSAAGQISESRDVFSWDRFIEVYGIPESDIRGDDSNVRTGEGGIPTPGPPPPSFDWQSGDLVIFTRTGETAFGPGRRTTQYRYDGNDWFIELNELEYCDPEFTVCRSDPQPTVGF